MDQRHGLYEKKQVIEQAFLPRPLKDLSSYHLESRSIVRPFFALNYNSLLTASEPPSTALP